MLYITKTCSLGFQQNKKRGKRRAGGTQNCANWLDNERIQLIFQRNGKNKQHAINN
jgi:hypothetical protein